MSYDFNRENCPKKNWKFLKANQRQVCPEPSELNIFLINE